MVTDPIADFLTRIRNANMAKHKMVEIPASKMKLAIANILFEQGYIVNYKFEEGVKPTLKIALKYHPKTKMPAISTITRVSKPGLRQYAGSENLPRVMNGLGIAIISTSNGVMTDKEARTQGIGGEVICYIS
jgi:small subunit ribosomal protein S8